MDLTPKEKAKELYDLFSKHAKYWDCYNDMPLEINHTKQCALIAVNEIINTLNCDIRDLDVQGNVLLDLIRYWREVKQELLKM